MQLDGLKKIYGKLKENNENYFLFKFIKNNTTFEILFDIFTNPFHLIFLEKQSDFKLKVEVKPGFFINPTISPSSVYYKLCDILELKPDPNNKFSPKSFFQEFNENIPIYSQRKKVKRELLYFYHSDIEEADKLYFDHFIEWNKIKNGRNVSLKNLEKTRILYPELYEKCKRENMSVAYSAINRHKI